MLDMEVQDDCGLNSWRRGSLSRLGDQMLGNEDLEMKRL